MKGRLSAAGATTFFPFSEAEAGVYLQGSGLRKIFDIHVGGYNAGKRRGPINLCSHASVSGPLASFFIVSIIIKASMFSSQAQGRGGPAPRGNCLVALPYIPMFVKNDCPCGL